VAFIFDGIAGITCAIGDKILFALDSEMGFGNY